MSQVHIPSVDDETFSAQVLTSDVPVLVEFGAVWCGPCRALGPILSALAQEGAGRWKVVAVDIDASPGIAAKHSVRGVPTVIVFSKGVEVGRHLGLTRRETLLGLLDRARSPVGLKRSAIGHQRSSDDVPLFSGDSRADG